MAKRFTETGKWSDPWFRKLTPTEKLIFLYVLDNCNNAGFLEIDEGLLLFQTGLTQDEYLGAKQGLNRGIKEADGWLWVKNFLRHQKNEALNPSNNAHRQIIALLGDQIDRFRSCDEFVFLIKRENLAPKQPLNRGTGKGKGSGSGRGKEEGNTTELVESSTREITAEEIYDAYPRKVARAEALKAIRKAMQSEDAGELLERTAIYAQSQKGKDLQYCPYPATWFNQKRYLDKGSESQANGSGPVDMMSSYVGNLRRGEA